MCGALTNESQEDAEELLDEMIINNHYANFPPKRHNISVAKNTMRQMQVSPSDGSREV